MIRSRSALSLWSDHAVLTRCDETTQWSLFVGKSCDDGAVDVQTSQENFLVEELVVVVQQNRGVVHGGETKSWNADLGIT